MTMHSRLRAALARAPRPRRREPRRYARAPLRLAAVRPRQPRAILISGTRSFACAIGAAGIVQRKREGDGATPIGRWPARAVFYRADRITRPLTALAAATLSPRDGWCDEPCARAYNRPVAMPFAAGHEALWRCDRLYDLAVVLGHNDAPVVPGAGSAIFIHVARPGLAPTEGCLALGRRDLALVVAALGAGRDIVIGPTPVRPASASGHRARHRRPDRGSASARRRRTA